MQSLHCPRGPFMDVQLQTPWRHCYGLAAGRRHGATAVAWLLAAHGRCSMLPTPSGRHGISCLPHLETRSHRWVHQMWLFMHTNAD